MSIESLIQAHTEALTANTEAVKLLTLSLAGRSATAASKAADAVEKLKADKVKQEEKKEEPKPETVVNVEEGIDVTPAVPYETVRVLLLKLAPSKRDEVKDVLKTAGISNLKVLLDKEDDFSTVNDQVKLEAVYADLQALEG